jgi:hypothetical protein
MKDIFYIVFGALIIYGVCTVAGKVGESRMENKKNAEIAKLKSQIVLLKKENIILKRKEEDEQKAFEKELERESQKQFEDERMKGLGE